MIDLHYWTTPNGHKVMIALEELGLPYRIVPVNISTGDQFKPDFLAIAPNNRIPAIAARPAVVRAYEIAAEVNTVPTVTAESKSVLFGQSAAIVQARA